MVVFKPVETQDSIHTWTVQLQYVNFSEIEETPPDVLKITYNTNELPIPEEVTFQIRDTKMSGVIKLNDEGRGEKVIDRQHLTEYLDSIIKEDGTITGSIPLILSWENQTEEITLPYLTAVKDYEETTWINC